MKTSGTVTVLGVRGSFPMAGKGFSEYGGTTSCFLADLGTETVILDAGSGLASLGATVPLPGGRKRVHVLLSHLHIDHIMGLFTPPCSLTRRRSSACTAMWACAPGWTPF